MAGCGTGGDLDCALSFWLDDGIVLPPNRPAIVGKDAIRTCVSGALAPPGFSITWANDRIGVSASRDLACSTGTDQVTAPTPRGQLVRERNKSLVIWKKQTDGSWTCAVGIWTPV